MSNKLANKILESLQEFNEKLESGEPIKATVVRREETDKGSVFTFTEATLVKDLEIKDK